MRLQNHIGCAPVLVHWQAKEVPLPPKKLKPLFWDAVPQPRIKVGVPCVCLGAGARKDDDIGWEG